jgi:hypothetical protein
MPGKKRSSAKTAKRKSVSAKRSPGRRALHKGTAQGESLLVDVARSLGSTLGTLAARSSQAAERLRAPARKKRS